MRAYDSLDVDGAVLEVSFIVSSYPVNAAKGANCAERAYKDICGCFCDT